MRRSIAAVLLGLLLVGQFPVEAGAVAREPSKDGTRAIRVPHSHVVKYRIGASIPGLKLSRLEMLNATVGVGIAPITTYAGALITAFLVKTDSGATSWTVSGTFPKRLGYPWMTAFVTPEKGYAIGSSGGVLYTTNAGRSWSNVASRGEPISISVKGGVVWVSAQLCPHGGMGSCYGLLETYDFGNLAPVSVSKVPNDSSMIAQVGPSDGYAIGNSNFSGEIFFTSNSGASWLRIHSSCDKFQITGAAVSSRSHLFVFCEPAVAPVSARVKLLASVNGGVSWSVRSVSPTMGLTAAASGNAKFVWTFAAGVLETGSEGGRTWSTQGSFKEGPGGNFVTYGAVDAWYAAIGHGIYRTLDGHSWKLLK